MVKPFRTEDINGLKCRTPEQAQEAIEHGRTAVSDERKRLAAELLPHLAEIMRLTRPAHGTVNAWLATANILQITLKDLIEEVQRQEGWQ